MTKSIKAALLSGLVFPGLGHIVLKQYLRGSILMLFSLIALAAIVTMATRRALEIVDSINNGQVPVELGALSELASHSMSNTDNSIANVSLIVFGLCWLIGIIDSYRLGMVREE